jgi:hypothetical protein
MWLAILTSTAFASGNVVAAAANDFKVPSFTAHQVVFSGQDLFAVGGTQAGTETINMNLALGWNYLAQTPEQTISYSNDLSTIYSTDTAGQTLSGSEVVAVDYTRYQSVGDRNTFYGVGAGFGAGSGAFSQEPINMDLRIGAQVGLGRVVDARTLAQAAQMFKLLGRKPSAAKLHAVAEVIGRRIAYINEHQYDSDIYFFKDLADALGGLTINQVYRIQQILDSPLYSIGSRHTGTEVGFAIDIGYGDMLRDVDSETMGQTTYAKVFATAAGIKGETNLLAYANMGCALAENATQAYTESVGSGSCDEFITAHAGARASVDHNSSWNTAAGIDLSPTMRTGSESGLYSIDMDLLFEGKMAVGSRVLWGTYASTGYTSTALGESIEWLISTDLTVFLL